MRVPIFRGGGPAAAWAGVGLAFGAVLLIISPRAQNASFALLASAMIVPSAWWMFCQLRGIQRRYWGVVGTLSAVLAVVALAMFPAAQDTPFGVPLFG